MKIGAKRPKAMTKFSMIFLMNNRNRASWINMHNTLRVPKKIIIQLSMIYIFFSTDDAFWNNLCTMTELRAHQVEVTKPDAYFLKHMKAPLSTDEMKAFIGVRIYMEYFLIKRTYASYWRDDGQFFISETPGFNDIFSRDRFLAIWSYLHLVDEQDATIDKTDRIYKLRPCLNTLLGKFQNHYVPHKFLSLDEGMIPCKNRLAFKQYLKDKPVKWGIKSFLLTDSTNGYVMNSEIYTGAENEPVPEIGKTGNVVHRLLTSSNLANKGHTLVMDRYYNSVLLSNHLHFDLLTGIIGTIQTNRKFFPKNLISKKLATRGDSKFQCHDNISAYVWMDRKPIYFISSAHDPAEIVTAPRREKNGNILQVRMPKAVQDYNKYMGGCDLNDQMTRLQRTRKHYKWPRRLLMKILMWAVYNSYILYRETVLPTRKPTFMDYLENLCMKLIGGWRSSHIRRRRRSSGDKRLTNVGLHMPVFLETVSTGHECVVCTKKRLVWKKAHPDIPDSENPHARSKSCFSCTECKAFLCLKRGSTCWSDFHLKVEFWR